MRASNVSGSYQTTHMLPCTHCVLHSDTLHDTAQVPAPPHDQSHVAPQVPTQLGSSQVLAQVFGQVPSQVGQPGQVHCV